MRKTYLVIKLLSIYVEDSMKIQPCVMVMVATSLMCGRGMVFLSDSQNDHSIGCSIIG